VELITSTSVGSNPPQLRSLQILIYLFGDHQLLCNRFTHLVVIEKATTTRSAIHYTMDGNYCHCHVPTKCNENSTPVGLLHKLVVMAGTPVTVMTGASTLIVLGR
jgi:hypothetical protein